MELHSIECQSKEGTAGPMLSRPEAQRLVALLEEIAAVLPAESRIAVGSKMRTAVVALNAYIEGRAFERQAVATAVGFLELEIRRLRWGHQDEGAEHERLWGEIDAIANEI